MVGNDHQCDVAGAVFGDRLAAPAVRKLLLGLLLRRP
jgi:hypothetical protein